MNHKPLLLAILMFSLLAVSAFAQGNLTPPGPPGPTMKTLDQLDAKLTTIDAKNEKRIPIDTTHTPGDDTADFIISQPGSYYLPANISVTKQHGIAVEAQDVTIDLNGFEVSTTTQPGGSAIVIDGFASQSCIVRNGTIFGFTSGRGIIGTFGARNCAVSGIAIIGCGIGIFCTGTGWIIDHCRVQACDTGIEVINSYLYSDGTLITNCTADANGTGIEADTRAVIFNCTANRNSVGIRIEGGEVRNCTCDNNAQDGILVSGDSSRVDGNSCHGNKIGYDIGGSENLIESNHSTDNTTGYNVTKPGNLIVRNSSKGGSVPFSVVSGNSVGHITDVWNNAAGADITTSNSWANFEY